MRNLILTLVIVSSLFLVSANSFAFDKCGQECVKCHTLSDDQARDVIKELAPDVKILGVQAGPINGLWEVAIESGGRKNIVYLDFSKKKVIAGNIFDVKTRTNYTQESFNRINKVDYSQIPLDNSVVMGDPNAKYKVVVFDDPD